MVDSVEENEKKMKQPEIEVKLTEGIGGEDEKKK